jgi:excisionase family DNA binding protein
MTADDVAARWRCSPEHVTRLARSRQLRAMKSGRIWRFRAEDVEAYERAHTSDPEADVDYRTARRLGCSTTTNLPPAVALAGDYAPVVKGPVPWRTEVIPPTAAAAAPTAMPAASPTRKARRGV